MIEAIEKILKDWTNPQEDVVISTEELGIEREDADQMKIYLWYDKDGRRGRGFYLSAQPSRQEGNVFRCLPLNGARMFVHEVGRVSAKGWKDARESITVDDLVSLIDNTE